jgi:hypothetical protein
VLKAAPIPLAAEHNIPKHSLLYVANALFYRLRRTFYNIHNLQHAFPTLAYRTYGRFPILLLYTSPYISLI